jgi:hypothetical protein
MKNRCAHFFSFGPVSFSVVSMGTLVSTRVLLGGGIGDEPASGGARLFWVVW